MEWLRYVLLGFAPGLAWLWYLRRKDRFEPEPRALVLRVFVLGALSPWLILWLRPALEPLLPAAIALPRLLLDAFVVTALCEELVKAAALTAGIGFHRELDEPLDGIVYGGAAALGFASVENVLFVQASGDPWLALQRGFTTTLLHLACTGTLGLLIARARITRRPRDAVAAVLGFAGAVALHGGYDAFILAGPRAGRIAVAIVLPLLLLIFAWFLRRAVRQSELCSLGASEADGVQCAAVRSSSDLIQSTSSPPNPRDP